MALWDGRFDGSPNELMQEFGESITIDLQMWREDIRGSKAHSQMLFEVGLLSSFASSRRLGSLSDTEL